MKVGSRGQIYTTKQKIKGFYPHVRQGNNVIVVGFVVEEAPIFGTKMKNLTVRITSHFVDDQVNLKKGSTAAYYAVLSVLHHSTIFFFASSLLFKVFAGMVNSATNVEFSINFLVFSKA